MNFRVITLFPEAVEAAARGIGVVGQAIHRGQIGLQTLSPRDFTTNVHHTVDDRPFGGGDGMIMLAEPLAQSLAKARETAVAEFANGAVAARPAVTSPTTAAPQPGVSGKPRIRMIHVSPRGSRLTDAKARELARYDDLILISSRYGGADQRFLNLVDEEISIGDYILTGGELACLVIIDAVARLQPNVLGNEASSTNETFAGSNGLLEHPQFTRPREWNGAQVPEIYLSGDHAKIALFQDALSLALTASRRDDLLKDKVPAKKYEKLRKLLVELSIEEWETAGLGDRALTLERLDRHQQS